MDILITGGAGFIGSHLTDKLISKGHKIICADKLAFDNKDNISHLMKDKNFIFREMDLANQNNIDYLFENYNPEAVYHLAANSDIQKGGKAPEIDFNDTFLTTRCVLEGMRKFNVKNLFFASTSAVYGEMCDELLTEQTGGIKPVSYYGGAKLASEAYISSYASMNDFNCIIFRFPNVIGPRLTHGVIFDFVKKLEANPHRLEILGDGSQCKPYIYVLDLVEAIWKMTQIWKPGVDVFNVSVEGNGTTVKYIAQAVADILGYQEVEFCYSGGDRGWKGDVPSFQYDISKILSTGWRPYYSSDVSVRKTIEEVKK